MANDFDVLLRNYMVHNTLRNKRTVNMRSGLYKSDVQSALNNLVAKGINPSVDAIRIELGNTGSKSTIHKYLKEIKEDHPNLGLKKVSVSNTILNLVEQLAAQLDAEKTEGIQEVRIESEEKARLDHETISSLTMRCNDLEEKLRQLELDYQKEVSERLGLQDALKNEVISSASLNQQIANLQENLINEKSHVQLIENMLTKNRDAFEHFQAATQEQRDQENIRHEAAIQQLQNENRQYRQKADSTQIELANLMQENSKIIVELSLLKESLKNAHEKEQKYLVDSQLLQQVSSKLQVSEELLLKNKSVEDNLSRKLDELEKENTNLRSKVHQKDLHITEMTARQSTRKQILDELQSNFCFLNREGDST